MNTRVFYKKVTLLLLTVLFQINMLATTINATSGSFSLNQNQYLDNMYQEWIIESGQNFPLLISYEVDIEGGYDYLYIYAIDNYDNLQLIKTISGSEAGVCSTQLPTGRALVVFETDGSACGSDGGYQGFTVNFGLENQQNDTHIINRLYVKENSFVNGSSSITGNLSIGQVNADSKSVNVYNNQKNQFGLYAYSYKSWSSNTYGIYSRAINGTSSNSGNVYGLYSSVTGATGKRWAGYFTGGDVEVNSGNLKVTGNSNLMGNVGIGTTSPNARLHVTGNPGSLAYITTTNGTISESATILFQGGRGIVGYDGTFQGMRFSVSDASKSLIFTNSLSNGVGEIMRITGNGNVGIGTSNPLHKLDVAGKIQTNDELIVTRSNLDIGGTISLGNSAKTEPGQASV